MIFLSIVDRELRVRARLKGTHSVRVAAGAFALLVAAVALNQSQLGLARGLTGQPAFIALTVLAMLYCLAEGIRSTADCLSEEKREGTLGLLFLTDLKGYDVVLGKLAATSLNSLYGLLAIVPVLALPLLAGGVSFGDFSKVALVLLNTLFFSLCVGIWVSARSTEEYKARRHTTWLLAATTIGPILVEAILCLGDLRFVRAILSLASPAHACCVAFASQYPGAESRYWVSVLFTHSGSWVLLLAAGRTLARRWAEEPTADPTETEGAKDAPAVLPDSLPAKTRVPLGGQNPVFWLATRSVRSQKWLWLLLLACCLYLPARAFLIRGMGGFWGFWVIQMAVHYGLWFYITVLVCRPLIELRRSGALELLLSTPLGPAGLLRGHRQALYRLLRWPVIMALVISAIPTLPSLLYLLFGFGSAYHPTRILQVVNLGLANVRPFFDVYAIAWMGTWLALSAAKPHQAAARTFVLVHVVPSLVIGYGPWALSPLLGMPFWLVPPILLIAVDLAFIRWARRKLATGFSHGVRQEVSAAEVTGEIFAPVTRLVRAWRTWRPGAK